MGWNLPPGCSVSDIPGNRPEDIAWQKFIERNGERLYKEFYKEEPESQADIDDMLIVDDQFGEFMHKKFKEMKERQYEREKERREAMKQDAEADAQALIDGEGKRFEEMEEKMKKLEEED